jgi:hypothetical protein
MKIPFSLFIATCLFSAGLHAQEEGDGFGFLNIVNLIPGDTPAEVEIGGKKLVPGGMKSGDFTGWFVVPVGSKSLAIAVEKPEGEAAAIAKATGEIQVTEGAANVVAMFLQPDPRTKPDGTPLPPRIRIKSFPAYDSRGFGLRFVSMCPEDMRFQIGSLKLDAKPLEPIVIPKWTGAGFEVMHNGKPVGKTAGSTEPGSFYLFTAPGEAGAFITVLTRSDPQVIPPWMKKEKKKPAEKP